MYVFETRKAWNGWFWNKKLWFLTDTLAKMSQNIVAYSFGSEHYKHIFLLKKKRRGGGASGRDRYECCCFYVLPLQAWIPGVSFIWHPWQLKALCRQDQCVYFLLSLRTLILSPHLANKTEVKKINPYLDI